MKQAAISIWPFLGMTLAYVAARLHALTAFSPATPFVSFTEMVLTWPSILWHDTKLLLLPWGYGLYYELPVVEHILSREFLVPAGLLLLTLATLVLLALRLKIRRDLVITSIVWFTVPLLPSLYLRGLNPEIFGQDRYVYLSCVGFATFASAIIVALSKLGIAESSSRSIQVYVAAILAAALASCSLVQQQYWSSNLALFRRSLTIAPNHNHALNNLAVALAEKREFGSAAVVFERALQQNPHSGFLNYNYGHAMYQAGNYKNALPLLGRATQLDPSLGEAFLYMGLSHFKLGYLKDAGLEIRRAIALEPERRGVHLAMGTVLEAQGDLPGALAETRIEANNFPDDPLIQRRLAMLEQRGEFKPVARVGH